MTRSLHVLVLGLNYAPEPTGIAPYTTGFARFLAEAGHDVHVVTGFPHYPDWKLPHDYPGRRVRQFDGDVRLTRLRLPIPKTPTGRSRIALEAAFALQAAAIRGPRPDVVIAVSPALLGVAATLRWRFSATPVGVIVQDLYSRALEETGSLGGRGIALAAWLERSLLRRADGVAAIHDSFRRSLVGLGIDEQRITTIRNWTHVGEAVTDLPELRTRLGWRDDEAIALYAGNMGAKQGLENVVDAARCADQQRLPIRFVLLGSGNQKARLQECARGVERLQFLDPLPGGEFERALAAADVLVLNERPEVAEMCVPSRLTSYLAAARPVLAATSVRSAATFEIVSSGGGRCIPPEEPQALLDAALLMADDASGGLEMGARGRAFARSTLTGAAARAGYLEWVERLAAGQDAPELVPRPRVGDTRTAEVSGGRPS